MNRPLSELLSLLIGALAGLVAYWVVRAVPWILPAAVRRDRSRGDRFEIAGLFLLMFVALVVRAVAFQGLYHGVPLRIALRELGWDWVWDLFYTLFIGTVILRNHRRSAGPRIAR